MHINGEWIPASGNKNFDVYNPANGGKIVSVPHGSRSALRRHEGDRPWVRRRPGGHFRIFRDKTCGVCYLKYSEAAVFIIRTAGLFNLNAVGLN